MGWYHFNITDGYRKEDREGVSLPSDMAARAAAIGYAGELLGDDPERFSQDEDLCIEVTDKAKTVLFTVRIVTERF